MEPEYQAILQTLERLRMSGGQEGVEAALILQNQLRTYQERWPDSGRNPTFEQLYEQTKQKLFDTSGITGADRANIILIAEQQPTLAAELYHELNQTQSRRPGFNQLTDGLRVQSSLTSDKERNRLSVIKSQLQKIQQPVNQLEKGSELVAAQTAGQTQIAVASLTPEQIGAISGYRVFNPLLREGGTLPELVRDYTVQAMNGLDTLPHYQGTVYHSEHVQDLSGLVAQLQPGQLVSDRGFLSTSASAEWVKEQRDNGTSVIYVIDEVKNGANVAGFTQQNTAKVLLLPGISLRVEAMQQVGEHLYVMLKQEADLTEGEHIRNLKGQLIGRVTESSTSVLAEIRVSVGNDAISHKMLDSHSLFIEWRHDSALPRRGLSDAAPFDIRAVSAWRKPVVQSQAEGGSTRFDGQLIIQLENDPVVREAADRLVGKHPQSSVLVQLDKYGNYSLDAETLRETLTGKTHLRWQLVGHGRDGETLGARLPEALAADLARFGQQLREKQGIAVLPQHISLVGCSLTGDDAESSYAHQFARSMDEQGIVADIAARRVRVDVSEDGRIQTEGADGVWRHKISDDKIVLSRNSLERRLRRVIKTIDALLQEGRALDDRILQLTSQQRHDLTDFFPTAKGYLDAGRLCQVITSDIPYLAWRERAVQLLQVPAVHAPLESLNGQQALEQYQRWQAGQLEAISALQTLVIPAQNGAETTRVNTQPIPQALYLDDNSSASASGSRALSLAWLGSQQSSHGDDEYFSSAVFGHGLSGEQQAAGLLSEGDASQAEAVRQGFEEFKSLPANSDCFRPATPQAVFSGQDRYYLLTSGNYQLAVASRTENGQHSLALYAPDAGVIRVTGSQASENAIKMKTLMTDYLNGQQQAGNPQTRAQYRGIHRDSGQWQFTVTKVDIPALQSAFPALNGAFSPPVDSTKRTPSVPPGLMVANRIAGPVGNGMQAHGYISGILNLIDSQQQIAELERQLKQPGLSAEDKERLEKELQEARISRDWDAASFGYNAGTDVAEYGLGKLGGQLARHAATRTAAGLPVTSSRLGKMAFSGGNKLARVGGPALSIIGAGFDIREAYMAFSKLSTTTDPKKRQDLIFQGSMSTVGAAVGVATGVALLAGGTAAMAAGPAGVAIGVGLLVAQQTYMAVRQVEEIKKYINLTPEQELRAGWLAFWGVEQDKHITDKLSKAIADEENTATREQSWQRYRDDYDELQRQHIDKFITDHQGMNIDAVFYTRGEFTLQEYHYKKVVGQKASFTTETARGGYTNSIFTRWEDLSDIEDRIHPDKANQQLEYYRDRTFHHYSDFENSIRKTSNVYRNVSLVDSNYTYYKSSTLRDTNDNVTSRGFFNDKDNDTTAVAWSYDASKMPDQRRIRIEDTIAWFRLGGGNDAATGNQFRKNIFEVGAGTKNFTGGPQADSFLLMGQAEPDEQGILDGAAGNDIVIGYAKPPEGLGYNINLKTGVAGYFRMPPLQWSHIKKKHSVNYTHVAQLRHIEHAQGHAETDDKLVGDDRDNQLNGAGGGVDILFGGRGNDMLTLQGGYARGGEGKDRYRILQNSRPLNTSVTIRETHNREESIILLDYLKENITAIELIAISGMVNVCITLRNDSGSETQIYLENVYSYNGSLTDLFTLHTRDGYLVQLPMQLQDSRPLAEQLSVYYEPELDRLWQQKVMGQITADTEEQIQRKSAETQTHVAGHTVQVEQLSGIHRGLQSLQQPGNEQSGVTSAKIQGVDTHRVWQNRSNSDDNMAEISATHPTDKIANILLDYRISQIESLSLTGNDVVFNLRNDNGSLTRLKLKDIYVSDSSGQQKTLSAHYLLYSLDGVLFGGLPPALWKNAEGQWPFTPQLTAQYQPDLDQDWQSSTAGQTAEEVKNITVDLQQRNARGHGQITVGDSTHRELPKFMQLQLRGTRFNTRLTGDDSDNRLESAYAPDHLSGKGGEDLYVIKTGSDVPSEVVIDNYDGAEDPAQDLIQITGWRQEDIVTTRSGNDAVLSHRNRAQQPVTVRLHDYFSSENHRHLLILDETGQLSIPQLNEAGEALLQAVQLTQQDDSLPVTADEGDWKYGTDDVDIMDGTEKNDRLYGLGGNDLLRGEAGNDTLDGGEGYDVLLGGAGDDLLLGGGGDDKLFGGTGNDMLDGGKGDDILEGGEGNDTYLFTRGDGHDTLTDIGGSDTLQLTGISKESVWLKQQGDDLIISINEADLGGSVTVKNHYRQSVFTEDKIEKIIVETHELTGSHIDQLVTAMAGFSSSDAGSLWQDNRVFQQSANALWLTTSAIVTQT